jgi:hypothetical protein
MPKQDADSIPFILDEEEKLHPFTMVPNELLRNESISPNCRWLISYLLSNVESWKINIGQIIKHLKPHMSKTKVYSLVKEACDSGYLLKIITKEKNLIRYSYKVSRTPKFKKCFRFPSFREVENAEHKKNMNIPILDSIEIEKKNMSDPPSSAGLTSFFIEKLKEINPKMRDPDRKKWEKQMSYLLTQDNRTEDEVKQVISFAVNHHKNATTEFTWGKNILSPEKLRKQFDSLLVAMEHDSKLKKERPKASNEIDPDEKWERQQLISSLARKNKDDKEVYIVDKGDYARIQKDDLHYNCKDFSDTLTRLITKYKLKN